MAALSGAALRWRRLRWRTARALRRRGAAALLAGAAFVLLLAALPWWQHARHAHGQAEARQRAAAAARSAAPRMPSPAATGRARLQAFYDALPAADEAPAVLQELIELARAQGLRFMRGSYRLERDPQAGFARYRMTLPVHGDAERIQRLLGAALQAFPTLAVEGIRSVAARPTTRRWK